MGKIYSPGWILFQVLEFDNSLKGNCTQNSKFCRHLCHYFFFMFQLFLSQSQWGPKQHQTLLTFIVWKKKIE